MSVGWEKGHVYICLLIYDHVFDVDLLMYRMNRTCHCGFMGRRCHYWRMENMPRVSLTSRLEQVEAFIHGRLEEISNDRLRFESNQTYSFPLPPWVTLCGITGSESLSLRLGCLVSLVGVVISA